MARARRDSQTAATHPNGKNRQYDHRFGKRAYPEAKSRVLTVHHTAVPAKPAVETAVKLRAFQQQMQNGYWIDTPSLREHVFLGDIPYHYYISAQGDVAEGRELDLPRTAIRSIALQS